MSINNFINLALSKEGKNRTSNRLALITSVLIIVLYSVFKKNISGDINFFLFTIIFGLPVIIFLITCSKFLKNQNAFYTKVRLSFILKIYIGCQVGYSIILFLALHSWVEKPELAVLEPIFVSCVTALGASMYFLRSFEQKIKKILKND